MSWLTLALELLNKGDIDRVIQFYEELTETEPGEITHYWYLGLAYLLQGREEEAQTTWLLVLSQGDETEIQGWTEGLVKILEEEANRQIELGNLELGWLIRGHLREIDPDQLENSLKLILLEIQLNRFHPNLLSERGVIELLSVSEVNANLLEQVLVSVIRYVHVNTLEFVRSSLPHLSDSPLFLDNILSATREIAYQQRQPLYAADLLELFCQKYSENWYLAVNLFWFYITIPNYQKAFQLARQLEKASSSLDLKLYSQSLLLNGLMRGSNWQDIAIICQEYKQRIQQLLQEKPDFLHPLVRDSLLSVMNPISYYEDNPQENRPLLSQMGQLFQKHYRESIGFEEIQKDKIDLDRFAPLCDRTNKKIKIGYIAQTFRRHPIGWLSRWIMQYHDRNQFHITLYLIDQQEDELTKKWFSHPEDKVYEFSLNSLAIAKHIQEDAIDILVDLDSGVTVGVAQVMALKPAPIQINWLGFDGSGLPAIDYLLADPYVLPEQAQKYYSEKIWRLPNAFIAVDGFEIAVPTLKREDLGIDSQAVIYLSSQTGIKRNPNIIRLQMQILKAVPHSYFLIQGVADEKTLQELFLTIAESEGVSSDQIKFIPLYPTELYRANLGIADIVLDTYPFNGGTTTLETLWMGIPMVTRVGQQWSSRNGYTLMRNAGITEGIAWSDEEYVQWGIKLGQDEKLREEVRGKLRQSRQTSPLWNAKRFTKDLEIAYRQMWEIYQQS